jgi:hypothetical protein
MFAGGIQTGPKGRKSLQVNAVLTSCEMQGLRKYGQRKESPPIRLLVPQNLKYMPANMPAIIDAVFTFLQPMETLSVCCEFGILVGFCCCCSDVER